MIISVINHTEGQIKDEALQSAIRAINRQVEEDFAPHWGFGAPLRLEGRTATSPKKQELTDMRGDAVIYLWNKTDVPGALGYHDANNHGIPFGFVFTELSQAVGENWTVTLSHEALELIGDSEVNLLVMRPHPAHPSRRCSTGARCLTPCRPRAIRSTRSRSPTSCCRPTSPAAGRPQRLPGPCLLRQDAAVLQRQPRRLRGLLQPQHEHARGALDAGRQVGRPPGRAQGVGAERAARRSPSGARHRNVGRAAGPQDHGGMTGCADEPAPAGVAPAHRCRAKAGQTA